MKIFKLILIVLIFCLSCIKNPTDNKKYIELRQDFSASKFKEAIIGRWISFFKGAGKSHVVYLELRRDNKAIIKIKSNNNVNAYGGNYSISFLRPPKERWVTLAEITIKTLKNTITLSKVSFGYHSMTMEPFVYILRIDKEPYGALQRYENDEFWRIHDSW